jgi:hypothetical protein
MILSSLSSFSSIAPIDSLQIDILFPNSSVEILETTNKMQNNNFGHSSQESAYYN